MSTIEKKFLETIAEHALIPQNQTIVVAVSGGPDSIGLLHLISSLLPDVTIHAVYINHQLRPDETGIEITCVEEQCTRLSVESHIRSVNVPQEVELTGDSIEACARKLRYRELEELMLSVGAGAIAVGHTSDDQAEEILIRLIRGSSLKGLSGMSHKNGNLIRPLLDIDKKEILDYLNSHRLTFCNDSSNDSRHFLRNRVRLDLLPLLEKQFNPSIRKTLIKTALILKDEDDYLQRETKQHFNSIVQPAAASPESESKPELALSRVELNTQHPALKRRIIEKALWQLNSTPNTAIIEDLINLAQHGNNGAELHLADRIRGVIQNETILLTRLPDDLEPRESLHQTVDIRIELSGPGTYDCDQLGKQLIIIQGSKGSPEGNNSLFADGNLLTYPLTLRQPEPGERFYPLGGQGSRKISRFFNDRKIPKQQRHYYPVVVSENKVVCVLGLSVDKRFAGTEEAADATFLTWVDLD